jgi:hypothetical protein
LPAGVVDHHPQRLGVAVQGPRVFRERQLGPAVGLGQPPVVDHLGHHGGGHDLLGPQHRAAVGHERAGLQELVDHVAQTFALADDPLEDLLAVGGGGHVGPADQDLGHAEDDRDASAARG